LLYKEKTQIKIEESTNEKSTNSSEIEFLKHKWSKLGRKNEYNLFSNIFYAVDANFTCLKHFRRVENAGKKRD
jgi:hypothetical protein